MISTKGRYALRFMIDLAEHSDSSPVPLDAIAKRQGISKKYMEIITKLLVTNKLVKGTSGKGGGYRLTRDPADYTVCEILEAAEGSLAPVACLQEDAEPCPDEVHCRTLPMWREYNMMIHSFFTSIRLSDLMDPDKHEIDLMKYSCL